MPIIFNLQSHSIIFYILAYHFLSPSFLLSSCENFPSESLPSAGVVSLISVSLARTKQWLCSFQKFKTTNSLGVSQEEGSSCNGATPAKVKVLSEHSMKPMRPRFVPHFLDCFSKVAVTHASAAAVFSSFNTLTLALQRYNQWSHHVRDSYKHFIAVNLRAVPKSQCSSNMYETNCKRNIHIPLKRLSEETGGSDISWYFISRLLCASASALPFNSLGPHYNQRKSPQVTKKLDGEVRIDRNNLTMQIAYITFHYIFCVYIGELSFARTLEGSKTAERMTHRSRAEPSSQHASRPDSHLAQKCCPVERCNILTSTKNVQEYPLLLCIERLHTMDHIFHKVISHDLDTRTTAL